MKNPVFAIKDHKNQTFGNPFMMPTSVDAMRQFEIVASDSRSIIAQYPNDFDLFEVGSFDNESGRLYSGELPKLIQKSATFGSNPDSSPFMKESNNG